MKIENASLLYVPHLGELRVHKMRQTRFLLVPKNYVDTLEKTVGKREIQLSCAVVNKEIRFFSELEKLEVDDWIVFSSRVTRQKTLTIPKRVLDRKHIKLGEWVYVILSPMLLNEFTSIVVGGGES